MKDDQTYDFCIPQAQYLADLVGIRSDLYMVRSLVNGFLAHASQPVAMETLYKNAFCLSAITTYGRTLGNGARVGIPRELIDSLEPEWIQAHDYFKALRDKWIAHSVNNFEQSRVTIQVTYGETGDASPKFISEGHNMTVSLSRDTMALLGRLSEVVLRTVKIRIEQEKETLLQYARTMDLSGLAAKPQSFARPEGPPVHDKRRPAF